MPVLHIPILCSFSSPFSKLLLCDHIIIYLSILFLMGSWVVSSLGRLWVLLVCSCTCLLEHTCTHSFWICDRWTHWVCDRWTHWVAVMHTFKWGSDGAGQISKAAVPLTPKQRSMRDLFFTLLPVLGVASLLLLVIGRVCGHFSLHCGLRFWVARAVGCPSCANWACGQSLLAVSAGTLVHFCNQLVVLFLIAFKSPVYMLDTRPLSSRYIIADVFSWGGLNFCFSVEQSSSF